MKEGYVKLWRRSERSEIFQLSPLHFKVWCWLLMNVTRQPKRIHKLGIDLEPGEITTTYKKIAEAVSWLDKRAYCEPTLKQLRTVVSHLQLLEMVELRHGQGQGYLHIKVLHWDEYQQTETLTGAESAALIRQDRGSDTAAIRQLEQEVKKERKKTLSSKSPQFDTFWADYPRKENKPAALKAWRKIETEKRATFDEIMAGLHRQLPDMRAKKQRGEGNFIPLPSSWLNGDRWADETEIAADTPEGRIISLRRLRGEMGDIATQALCTDEEWEEVCDRA